MRTYVDGTSASPVFSWSADTNTGIRRSGNDEISFVTNGNDRLRITSGGTVRAIASGSATNPIFGWDGDPNTGFYSPAADQFGLTTGGVERLRIPNADQVLAMAAGSTTNPFYSFNGDNDTGIWRSDLDRLNISAGGLEFMEFRENGNNQLVMNDTGADMNVRIETENEANAIFTDGGKRQYWFGNRYS